MVKVPSKKTDLHQNSLGPSPFLCETFNNFMGTFTATLVSQLYVLPTVLQMYRQERLYGVLFAARGAEQHRGDLEEGMARRKGDWMRESKKKEKDMKEEGQKVG